MGRDIYVHNELRRRLGPDEAVRVDCGAVALWARGLSTYFTAKIEPIVPSGAAVASLSASLRSRGRRTHPLLPVEDISGSIGISSSFTDPQTTEKCIEKSRRLRPVVGLRPSVRCVARSSPVAGRLKINKVQLALRPKATGETKDRAIAKRLARRRGHTKTLQ